MDTIREAKATADRWFDKVATTAGEVSREGYRIYTAGKIRTQRFVETGMTHYRQTEEAALTRFKDGMGWLMGHQTYAAVLAGASAVVVLPTLRRAVMRRTMRPFRSDESIYKSAENRLETVHANLKAHQEKTEKLEGELSSMLEAYSSALQELKTTSQELNSFSNQIHRDIRSTHELLRDMKEMPSRPSLKMQSEAAVALRDLDRQNRQVDNLLYKVMQKGI